MNTVPNDAQRPDVHFPYGHMWSCGDTFNKPTSGYAADVTCSVCLGEMGAEEFLIRQDVNRTARIQRAIDALSAFGDADLDQETGRRLLAMWSGRHLLDAKMVAEIVASFPQQGGES